MAKNRSAAGITNIVQYDANRNITFVSGSTTLLTVSSSGALTTTGTITAQTLVVQTVTSSVNFITGSTKFGSLIGNTHQFTGSVTVTGSLAVVTNGTELQVNATGVNLGNIITDTHNVTGSLRVTGSVTAVSKLEALFPNTGGSIDNNPYLRLVNTGTSTLSQSIDLVMRWQDGTYNGTGGISMVRESATARSGRLVLQPINSSGDNINALTITSTGAAIFSSSTSAVSFTASDRFLASANAAYRVNTFTDGVLGYMLRSGVWKGNSENNLGFATDGPYGITFFTNGSATERVTITSSGNVGIAGTAGSGRLQVWGEDQSGSNFGLNVYNSGGFGMFFVRNDGNIRTNSGMYGNTTSGTTRTVFVGNGDFYLGGISSIRASKKNIENIPNIDWIYQLNPVTFNYRKKDEEGNYTEETFDELTYGLIAEDTAPIADFLINYNDKEDGTKEMIGIEYMRLITPMLKAIQELKSQNDSLQQQINELKA